MIVPLLCLAAGILCGRLLHSNLLIQAADTGIQFSLWLVIFTAGVDIGTQKNIVAQIKKSRWRVLLIPVGTVAGSILGGVAAGKLLGLPPQVAASVAGGLAYYSLSVGILTPLGGPALGALTFCANVLRELLSLLAIPWIARWLGPWAAVAPAGATSMDTALGVICSCTSQEMTLLSVINGVILTAAVPVLVPLLYRIL